jgi:uncharacterized protein DUF3107
VEVKIGVQYAVREIVFESTGSADDIEKAVSDAIAKGTMLNLADERGRRILVPGEKLAYVEIGEPVERRVGFGTI